MNDTGPGFGMSALIGLMFLGLLMIGLIGTIIEVVKDRWDIILICALVFVSLLVLAVYVARMQPPDDPKTHNQKYWDWRNRQD